MFSSSTVSITHPTHGGDKLVPPRQLRKSNRTVQSPNPQLI